MANSDKNITITSAKDTTAEPTLEFTGGNNTPVRIRTLDDGSLTFEGSSGTLFTISNSLTGTLFAANDVSGIPGIDLNDLGLIRLAPYDGQVLIGQLAASSATGADSANDILQIDGNCFINGNAFVTGTVTGSINLNATAPATDTAIGAVGEIRVDDSYIYVCTAANTWKRVELNLTTWS